MDGTRDWRQRLMTLLWTASLLLVTVSAVTLGVAALTEGSSSGRFWAEVHENLSVGVEFNLPTWFATVLWALFALIA